MFSVAYLVSKDYDGLVRLFQDEIKADELHYAGWAQWLSAFALLQKKDIESAKSCFLFVVHACRNEMVRLLAFYVLIDILKIELDNEDYLLFLRKFKERYSAKSWLGKINRKRNQLHILVLSNFIQKAGEWCIQNDQVSPSIISLNLHGSSEIN